MPFNSSQKKAIYHINGPMMVLAGPGSGKTTVITHRTRYLIEQGIDPGNILVITFTRAAAREMQERFITLMDGKSTRVSFGTFHSVFFTILKHAYRYQASDIVREEQKIRFIREMIEKYQLEIQDEHEFVPSILGEISFVKSEMLSLTHYYSRNCSEAVFKKLYQGYEKRMREARLLDFDDMLVMCHELFVQRKDILEAWQNKFRYILIDEFQDINKVQYEIVKMLALPENNLFIVGDDDQSIYRFRGAKPEIMLGFTENYPTAKTVLLGINYRSTREIVNTASDLISHNTKRYKKKLTAAKGAGKPVVTCVSSEPQEETLRIVEEIKDYVRAGYHLEDIAVLYRTNLDPRLMIEKLMEYNIPFTMKDSLPNLYEHWISKNVLAYIRAAKGDLKRSNILQIINRPNRYISRDALEDTTVSWNKMKSFYQDKGWMVERIEQLEYDLSMLKDMPPAAAVNYIRKAVGYDDYIKEYAQFRRINPEELLEFLDQLKESAAGFKTMEAWFQNMGEYKEKLQEQARAQRAEPQGVSLMTMHSSKGLEFKIVYILDANEGIIPHRKAVLDADMEEERRMFYVAMTRAKERLHVCYVRERYGKRQDCSRFVEEYQKNADAIGSLSKNFETALV
ncbi:MAG: ATP-dependent helicase [Hungatella sp.]|nr:ATP-dependent helicase [Hungatella sp.]